MGKRNYEVWVTQDILKALVETQSCVTLDQLVDKIKREKRRLLKCLKILRDRGLAEHVRLGCYRATETGREVFNAGLKLASGPRPAPATRRPNIGPSLRASAWRIFRLRKKASIPDLLALVNVPNVSGYATVQPYIRALNLCGVLHELPTREAGTSINSNGFKRYLLVRDLGPKEPMLLRDGRLFDQNSGTILDPVMTSTDKRKARVA